MHINFMDLIDDKLVVITDIYISRYQIFCNPQQWYKKFVVELLTFVHEEKKLKMN